MFLQDLEISWLVLFEKVWVYKIKENGRKYIFWKIPQIVLLQNKSELRERDGGGGGGEGVNGRKLKVSRY